jgi:SagB-type dehydrogenase family enzyme
MIDHNEHFSYFAQFFSKTEITNWEGALSLKDSNQRVKAYPRLLRHKLPQPTVLTSRSLSDVLKERQSAQKLSLEKFTLLEVSTILASVGLKPKSSRSSFGGRTYPSAGAKYPGETYIIILDCDELRPGLYHYAINEHELEELWIHDLRAPLLAATNDQRVLSASVVMIFSLVFGRVAEKYGDRGVRYGLIELGHMAQNISLVAHTLHKACYDIGGFIDSTVNTWLDIDNEIEAAALLMVLGGEHEEFDAES